LFVAGRLGCAMANGHPDVLAAADEVVPGNDDDGVARTVRRLPDSPRHDDIQGGHVGTIRRRTSVQPGIATETAMSISHVKPGGTMALNLNSIMLGSEDSKKLADFYTEVLGPPNPDWSDDAGGWFGFQAGDGGLIIGPHSEVHGKSDQPARIMLNFATPDVTGEFARIKAAGAEVVAEPYEPGGGVGC